MDTLHQNYTYLWWILYILSNCSLESFFCSCFTHLLIYLLFPLLFGLVFSLIFHCPQCFLTKSFNLCFLRKGRESQVDWKYDFIHPSFMTIRTIADLFQDPAVSSWCWLTGVYSPTVLLSKFKLYGSAKEKCYHSVKTAEWLIFLEWARHWSMTEAVWCIRNRLAWSNIFFYGSLLSPKYTMTNFIL